MGFSLTCPFLGRHHTDSDVTRSPSYHHLQLAAAPASCRAQGDVAKGLGRGTVDVLMWWRQRQPQSPLQAFPRHLLPAASQACTQGPLLPLASLWGCFSHGPSRSPLSSAPWPSSQSQAPSSAPLAPSVGQGLPALPQSQGRRRLPGLRTLPPGTGPADPPRRRPEPTRPAWRLCPLCGV